MLKTMMFRSLLLWTMSGNSEEINNFFLFQLYSQKKKKTYCGLQKDCNYYCKKSFTIWLPRGSCIWNKMLMKPTGKMEKSEPQMDSDFSVFPVGFISNLFHIYHSYTVTSLLENCHLSVKGLYLVILWEIYWQLK